MDDKSSGIRVCVYGTLKKGHYNHGLLDGAVFLGRTVVRGNMAMVDLTHYPCVVVDDRLPADGAILGEVYRIDDDTLASLDLLEGHPSYFRRIKVDTPWKSAWMYTLPSEYLEREVMDMGIWEPTAEEEAFYDELVVA
jgi:gamma-glutamylcyclotransferase (GGCT)/AIG2-like uncharacterized protein YtfP